MGVATIYMYLRTYYEGVAKHVVRRDTITMVASIQALSRMSGYSRMRRKTEEAREGLDHYDLNTVNVV